MTLPRSSDLETLTLPAKRIVPVGRIEPARRLLIIGCSMRKLPVEGHMRAWSLYDGVVYRMLKRMQREGEFPADVDVVILSARYGLIRPATLINSYDQKMTCDRAREQAAQNRSLLRSIMSAESYREVFASLGQTYMEAIEPVSDWLPQRASFRAAQGGIGSKMGELKIWLTAKD